MKVEKILVPLSQNVEAGKVEDKEYDLLIGETQDDNDTIIKMSNQNDIWFHLENISGPHIVLQSNGDIIPKRYLNRIGSLFPFYKNGLAKHYTVIYTDIKNVKLTHVKGKVHVSKTRKISY